MSRYIIGTIGVDFSDGILFFLYLKIREEKECESPEGNPAGGASWIGEGKEEGEGSE